VPAAQTLPDEVGIQSNPAGSSSRRKGSCGFPEMKKGRSSISFDVEKRGSARDGSPGVVDLGCMRRGMTRDRTVERHMSSAKE
jgi:hypothetical protein